MKETKKIIPFAFAALMAIAMFASNPGGEDHLAKIKDEYIARNPKTWRATWWNYERSSEYYDYLFFSVTKRKHRPVSYGILGMVVINSEDQ